MHPLAIVMALAATTATAQPTCITKPYHIQGTSLAPAIPNGATLMALTGKDCPLGTHITHGALVLFRNGAATQPIAKFVCGVEGDTLTLTPTKNGLLQPRLNGKILTTTSGQPYAWQPRHANMVKLALTPSGTIPAGALLVLGEDPTGTLDSTHYGLIARTDIEGVFLRSQPH